MNKIKVMIVDDHLVVREGLRQLLEIDDDIEVISEASNGFECLQLLEKSCPDLVFMDVRMPGISGIETTRLVCRRYPQTRVIMLTIYEDDQYVTEAIRAGARGYVLKKVNRDELIRIVRHVMEDRAFLDPNVTATVFSRIKQGEKGLEQAEKVRFTQREFEVLKGLVAGLTDRMIGKSLHISEHTVRSHVKSIYRKMGVSSRAQAATRAIRDEIINVDI
jgi:DNA-binding NarL/FixJ family response regulator